MSGFIASKRSRRAFRPGMDNCEQRMLMAGGTLALDIGLNLAQAALGVGLSQQQGNATAAQLAAIKSELVDIDNKLTSVENGITSITNQLDLSTLTGIRSTLRLDKIDSDWTELVSFVNNSSQYTDADRTAFANQIKTDLSGVVQNYTTAFNGISNNGANQVPTLMKAFSTVLKAQTSGFLTSTYSSNMSNAFDYYTAEEAKAVALLVNADNELGLSGTATYDLSQLPTSSSTQWNAELATSTAAGNSLLRPRVRVI